MTTNVKNNRTDTFNSDMGFAADVTIQGELFLDGAFNPETIRVSLPSINASHSALLAISDGNGGILGYVKIFPVA